MERYVLYGVKVVGTSKCEGPELVVDVAKNMDWILRNIRKKMIKKPFGG
jgi:hypothetical protein